mmetsp:Transcript_2889/g.3050  ORF Transcript_2889/g.3050 Transcript_2889/m.3050 type:complete len:203 (-) Transcript_2889:169-777(-)|eukprot:CAMPEP_0182428300 /NCGR_PEP_ID=MMETSP1167-20130531/22118_1 /TAXON_ID=2988 /ORGANISM="Mallomonas Sp, Strain CCMP3275" /LENGTH=202 /DNA_ID=CAMNT_0024611105 /DNA_START=72 /DNA_END=680 /DNA_ORIENTATION=+
MIKAIAILSSLIGASAFAPAGRAAPQSAMKMAFESAEGAQPPLGFFDPLGLLKEADQERFDNLRFVELKHGRIAMLGVVGHLVQQNYRFPGSIDLDGTSFSDLPNGFAGLAAVPAFGLFQIIASIGWWELKGWKQVEGSTPGDFGIPYLNGIDSEEDRRKKRMIELNNGRAAMMGLLALLIHEQINHRPYVINDILGLPYDF